MVEDKTHTKEHDGLPPPSHRLAEAAAVSGAVAGGVAGAVAGPPGVIIGSMLGCAIGAAAGVVLEGAEHANVEHDAMLDSDIGVIGGDLGAASPTAPSARIGAFSSGSTGSAGGSRETQVPAEGLMPAGDD